MQIDEPIPSFIPDLPTEMEVDNIEYTISPEIVEEIIATDVARVVALRSSKRIEANAEPNIPQHPPLLTVTARCHNKNLVHHKFCASITLNHKRPYLDHGKFNKTCPHCKALKLRAELQDEKFSNKCCSNGNVNLEMLYTTLQEGRPTLLKNILNPRDHRQKQFVQNSRYYNSELSMGSISSEQDADIPTTGPPVVKLNGLIQHCCSDLFPPANRTPRYGQHFVIDVHQSMITRRESLSDRLDSSLLENLDQMLREYHPFTKVYRQAGQIYRELEERAANEGTLMPKFRLTLLADRESGAIRDPNLHPHLTSLPLEGQENVAIVWQSRDGEPPSCQGIYLNGRDGRIVNIPYWDPNCDTLTYSLLFPLGTQMFNNSIPLQNVTEVEGRTARKSVSRRQFFRYIVERRGNTINDQHWLFSFGPLGEAYLIDKLSQIERQEFDNQKRFIKPNSRIANRQELELAYSRILKPGEKIGSIFTIPSTHRGSRAYYQKMYSNLMAISRAKGSFSLFITFTGNPYWPEIVEAIKKNPHVKQVDIICRVFRVKAEELLIDLTQRNVMGKVVGYHAVIEHQKRGMPHMHVLLILEENEYYNTPQYVDDFISAEIPNFPEDNDHSPYAVQQRRLYKIVTKYNIHSCNEKSTCNVIKNGRNFCTKRYPKPFSPATDITNAFPNYRRRPPTSVRLDSSTTEEQIDLPDDIFNDGEEALFEDIVYRRRPPINITENVTVQNMHQFGNSFTRQIGRSRINIVIDNSRVVPYNPYLSLKYESHINVEYSRSHRCAKYLCKYTTKGHDMAYIRIERDHDGGAAGIVDIDESKFLLKTRFMTSAEAYLRLQSYFIIKQSHSVIRLTIHLPGQESVVFNEGEEGQAIQRSTDSQLTAFFKLCQSDGDACQHTYLSVQEFYSFDKRFKRYKKRDLTINPQDFIVHIKRAPPRNIELYALRILLFHVRGPKNFEDIRTFNDTLFDTFAECARARGLMISTQANEAAIADAANELRSSNAFRHYVLQVFVHNTPENCLELIKHFLDHLFPPAIDENSTEQQEERLNHAIGWFRYHLQTKYNMDSVDIGLDAPMDYVHDPQIFENDNLNLAGISAAVQNRVQTLNEDQRYVFEMVKASLEADSNDLTEARLFFVQGAGGTGKTYLYNTIIDYAISVGKSVRVCASTGIAATLLRGGMTVHSAFGVPIDCDETTKPRMKAHHYNAQLLASTNLIIIDEISMLNKHILRYVNDQLKDLQPNARLRDLPFGGRIIVLGGDWKQLPPIVKGASMIDVFTESIKSCPIYSSAFIKFNLNINLRVEPSESEFSTFLIAIGTGSNFITPDSNLVEFPDSLFVNSIQELLEFVYCPEYLDAPIENAISFCSNAILCPTNCSVNHINQLILSKIQGEQTIYLSSDQILDETLDILNDINMDDENLELINNETPSGFPKHRLVLKRGAIVILLKNLDVQNGLCNGTRLQVIHCGQHNIKCRILTTNSSDVNVLIPKVRFEHKPVIQVGKQLSIPFVRLQFPLALAFAMTINKSQGQTLDKVGLDLSNGPVFSHGQLYTALSRVRKFDSIKILADIRRCNPRLIENVVFPPFIE